MVMEISNIHNYMSIRQLIKFILLFILLNVVVSILILPFLRLSGESMAINVSKILYVPIFVLVILYLKNQRRKQFAISDTPVPKLKFGGIKMYYVLLGIITISAFGIVLEPLDRLIPQSELLRYYNVFENSDVLLNIFSGVLMAPILEEIVFRGYIQQDLAVRYGRFYSILLSAATFGIIHLSLVQSISAFVAGVVIGFFFYIGKCSMTNVILIHLLNNFISFFFLKFDRGEDNLLTLTDIIKDSQLITTIQTVSYLIVAIFVFSLFYCAYRWRKQSL